MNRAEFVKNAVRRGYASEGVAEMYAEGQDAFDQSDLANVYALQKESPSRDPAWISLGGGNYKRKAIFYD